MENGSRRIKPCTAHLLEGGQYSMLCGGEEDSCRDHSKFASGVKGPAAAAQEEAEAESPEALTSIKPLPTWGCSDSVQGN